MRVIICSGVTAGHINPALAVANEIMINQPDSDILFAIFPEGMEERLVTEAGYKHVKINTRPFVRKLTPVGIYWNIRTAYSLVKSTVQANKLISDFKPDIMLGFGGFTSGPVIRCGAKKGIPTAIHEANAFPGMANKLLAKQVDLIMLGMEAARERFACPEKCVFTGNPVRHRVFSADRETEREKRGIGPKDLCVLSMGGSNGAKKINDAVLGYLSSCREKKDYFHFHSTGSIEYEGFMTSFAEKGIDADMYPGIVVSEYITDVPECLAAADLVIARAGAMTLAEISASGTASVLIPSPNVTENHQYYNALALEKIGAAKIIEEKELTPERLRETVEGLSMDELKQMGQSAKTVSNPNSTGAVYEQIMKLLGEKSV